MKRPIASSTFTDRVIKIALSIPPGKVTTYGRIARAAGSGGNGCAKHYRNPWQSLPIGN